MQIMKHLFKLVVTKKKSSIEKIHIRTDTDHFQIVSDNNDPIMDYWPVQLQPCSLYSFMLHINLLFRHNNHLLPNYLLVIFLNSPSPVSAKCTHPIFTGQRNALYIELGTDARSYNEV